MAQATCPECGLSFEPEQGALIVECPRCGTAFPFRQPSKKELFELMLSRGVVTLFFDPRVVDVVVPDAFRRRPDLAFDIGLNMPVPIVDLAITDEGVACTLSFSRVPHWCYVPWTSVFQMVLKDTGETGFWSNDVPGELSSPAPQKPVRNGLRAIASAPSGEGEAAAPAPKAKRSASKAAPKKKAASPKLRSVPPLPPAPPGEPVPDTLPEPRPSRLPPGWRVIRQPDE